MDLALAAVVAIAATAVGVMVGFVVRSTFASRAMKDADEKAALIIEKARSQQKDLILQRD